MFYADSMAFLQPPLKVVDGKLVVQPPIADPEINLQLAHLTSAPPFAQTMEAVTKFHKEFSEKVLSQELKTKVIFGLQHAPEDIDVRALWMLGIRSLGVAYDKVNRFGSGFATSKGGITKDGLRLLDDCVQTDISVDISHANHQTAYDVIRAGKIVKLSVWASHCGCYEVYPHMRNLSDGVLRGIADLEGVVGINTLTFVLDAERSDLEPFVVHLRHAINVCGEDSVCIGSDGYYTTESRTDGLARFEVMKKALDTSGAFKPRYPDQPPELNTPKRMEVIEQRLAREFKPATLEKILGLNLKNFLERSL